MNTNNNHFTDYKILEADDAEELSQKVMHAIYNSWQPFGDMAIAKTHTDSVERLKLFQPIVQQSEWFR